jgi:hypothetical protein
VGPKVTVAAKIASQIKSALSRYFATGIYHKSRTIETCGNRKASRADIAWSSPAGVALLDPSAAAQF